MNLQSDDKQTNIADNSKDDAHLPLQGLNGQSVLRAVQPAASPGVKQNSNRLTAKLQNLTTYKVENINTLEGTPNLLRE